MTSFYVDVHAHLTHEKYAQDVAQVIARATEAKMGAIVVNGLEPGSSRQVLALGARFPLVKVALGIYPVYAAIHATTLPKPFNLAPFDLDKEIAFIDEMARNKKIAAVGECGLDGYWLPPEMTAPQEKVFASLMEVARRNDLPIIVHTRKLEARAMDMLAEGKNSKVIFHCFSGKSKLAINGAEKHGWHFSIPANAPKNEGFQKLLRSLPESSILTETDSPYLAPTAGTRNEPSTVVGTVKLLADLRNWSEDKARDLVWDNYQRIFGEVASVGRI
jgi:TatD DNase family protein